MSHYSTSHSTIAVSGLLLPHLVFHAMASSSSFVARFAYTLPARLHPSTRRGWLCILGLAFTGGYLALVSTSSFTTWLLAWYVATSTTSSTSWLALVWLLASSTSSPTTMVGPLHVFTTLIPEPRTSFFSHTPFPRTLPRALSPIPRSQHTR